jgi:hypothetical protein
MEFLCLTWSRSQNFITAPDPAKSFSFLRLRFHDIVLEKKNKYLKEHSQKGQDQRKYRNMAVTECQGSKIIVVRSGNGFDINFRSSMLKII